MAEALLDGAPDEISQARLLAVSHPETGTWLNVLPLLSLGLCMEDDTVWIAVGLCFTLCTPLCRPHRCHQCGAEVDNFVDWVVDIDILDMHLLMISFIDHWHWPESPLIWNHRICIDWMAVGRMGLVHCHGRGVGWLYGMLPTCPDIFAVETAGVFGQEARDFFTELGKWVEIVMGEPNSRQKLIQCILSCFICREGMLWQFWGLLDCLTLQSDFVYVTN